jgi:hypothetical protein
MRASRSSELRSKLGPMANIMGDADSTRMEVRQPRQVPLTTMSKLSLMVDSWIVTTTSGDQIGSVLPLRGGVRRLSLPTWWLEWRSYVATRGLTITPEICDIVLDLLTEISGVTLPYPFGP